MVVIFFIKIKLVGRRNKVKIDVGDIKIIVQNIVARRPFKNVRELKTACLGIDSHWRSVNNQWVALDFNI